jgi:hypothetical protein
MHQYETHCALSAIKAVGPGQWRARARCTAEGDNLVGAIRFRLDGSRLTITYPDGHSLTYGRC